MLDKIDADRAAVVEAWLGGEMQKSLAQANGFKSANSIARKLRRFVLVWAHSRNRRGFDLCPESISFRSVAAQALDDYKSGNYRINA